MKNAFYLKTKKYFYMYYLKKKTDFEMFEVRMIMHLYL